MITEDPSPETFASSEWPRHCVLRSSVEPDQKASADLLAPQDIQMALSGGAVQTVEELTSIISERLNLPKFATRTPTTFANTLDRHLFVLAKTNQHLQIKLTQAEEVPEAVMTLLLQWVKRTPLRLLLIGAPSANASSSELMQALGIELLDLDDHRADAGELDELLDELVITDPEIADIELDGLTLDELTLDDELDDGLSELAVPVEDNAVMDNHPTPSKNNLALGLAFTGLAAATLAWFFFTGEPEPSETKRSEGAVVEQEPQSGSISELSEPEIADVLPTPEPTENLAPVQKPDPVPQLEPASNTEATPKPEVTAKSEPVVKAEPTPAPTLAPKPVAVPKAVYTIQIGSYLSAELRDEYLQNPQAVASGLRGAQSKSGGRFKSLVVYGSYADYAAAAKAIKALPEALQKSQPFPIKVSGLVDGANLK